MTAEGTFCHKEVAFVAARAFIEQNAMELARLGHGFSGIQLVVNKYDQYVTDGLST
jgi:hypothetical protein